jgi:hypothetical protein
MDQQHRTELAHNQSRGLLGGGGQAGTGVRTAQGASGSLKAATPIFLHREAAVRAPDQKETTSENTDIKEESAQEGGRSTGMTKI